MIENLHSISKVFETVSPANRPRISPAFLLLSTFFFSMAVFCYFPYITTSFADYISVDPIDIASMLAIGTFFGNVVALAISVLANINKTRFVSALFFVMCCVSIVTPLVLKSLSNGILLFVVAISVFFYRLSIAMIFNFIRFIQLEYIQNSESKLKLFTNTKLFFGLGSASGPIVGYLSLGTAGIVGAAAVSVVLTCISAALVLYTKPISRNNNFEELSVIRFSFTGIFKDKVALLSYISGFFYVMLESQIYSYISLTIKKNFSGYESSISLFFIINAVSLIIALPLFSMVSDRIQNRRILLLPAAMCSLAAVIFIPNINSDFGVIVIALLITIGEAVVPQLLLDYATRSHTVHQNRNSIALFNFFTSGLGMGAGIWFGGIAVTYFSPTQASVFWILFFVAYVISIYFTERFEVRAR